MNSYILDASVAAKWFLPEEGETLVSEALGVLDHFRRGKIGLLVPDLFWLCLSPSDSIERFMTRFTWPWRCTQAGSC